MSKAYQLCGQAQIGAGWADQAVVTLERGYALAAERGDRMVEQAIAKALESIGREPPRIERASRPAAAVADGSFVCKRTGQPGTRLSGPPFKGPVGAWIGENISAETWRNWIGQGTKVINEMRLDFSRDKDQDIYDQHMREYLGIDDEVLASIAVAKPVA
jgi:Fe-S cluster biosynthesis and repair protein YggX